MIRSAVIIENIVSNLISSLWFRIFIIQGVVGILIFEWCYQ